MHMTFGIHVGHVGGPLEEMRRLWKFADTAGFDWFSVSDHFQETPVRDGTEPCFEGVTTLTAAALETQHVRLGCAMFCVTYRNPGLLAKQLTSLDHLSNGRVECGLGAGWSDAEARAYGFAFPSIGVREDMLEEYAQVLRMLFDPECKHANFTGRHFQMLNAPNSPKPLQQRLPIWIGGRGEKRTLRAAARFADGWNGNYIGPDDWIHKNKVLDTWCEKGGRDPATILRSLNVGFYMGADAKGAELGEKTLRRHFAERADQPSGWLRGTPSDVLELVGKFHDAGCTRLNIVVREGPYDWDALTAFAEQVIPTFSSKPRASIR